MLPVRALASMLDEVLDIVLQIILNHYRRRWLSLLQGFLETDIAFNLINIEDGLETHPRGKFIRSVTGKKSL